MDNKFTKGSWVISITNGIQYIKSEEGLYLATVHGLENGKDNENKKAESVANTKLIAAAPDMLEALYEAESTIETLMREHNDNSASFLMSLDQIKKAIKKAKA